MVVIVLVVEMTGIVGWPRSSLMIWCHCESQFAVFLVEIYKMFFEKIIIMSQPERA